LLSFLSEIPLRIKRPVEIAGDPIRQTLNINLNLCIDLQAPRWELGPALGEAIDGLFTKVTNEVYGLLKGHPVVVHHEYDHIVRVACGLFAVVREEVLENVENENLRSVNNPEWMLTFDQETKSFAASSKL